MSIGDNIRYFRKYKGLTQKELSRKSNIVLGTLRKYESGEIKPSDEQLAKIAIGLEISTQLLKGFDIKTLGDVASVLFELDKLANIEFIKIPDANENQKKQFALTFNDMNVNTLINEWAKLYFTFKKIRDEGKEGDLIQGVPYEEWISNTFESFKLYKIVSPLLIREDSDGIWVKLFDEP